MRPILLDLQGFASYRAQATIDFRDSDFFVLVGPTGSGKSTVIDAMVFALYGTVPRWDDRHAVAPALAPTVNRGVVRLIFDAGGKRYAATRDVRRSGGKNPTVTIREARLEQYVSPDATGDPDDDIVSLATGRAVSGAVEKILGLNFGQFTQSVALPQGEFARFLHATDGERQAILKNLLGYGVYDRIQKAAYSRASDAGAKADMLAEQLEHYADATAEDVEERRRTREELRALREHVTSVALPALRSAFDAAAAARASLETLAAQRVQLLSVAKPDGVDTLDALKRAAAAQLLAAESGQRTIEERDNQIRSALRALRPRYELEKALAHWGELGEVNTRLPNLADSVAAADSFLAHATSARDAADAAARTARDAADAAAQLATEHGAQRDTARTHLELVHTLRAPDDITVVAESLRRAAESLAAANSRLSDCETAQQQVTAELDALPSSTVLSAAQGAAEVVLAVITQDRDEAAQRAAAADAAESTRLLAESAATRLAAAEHALRTAEHADQAATLRADLHPGEDCPVCGHEVIELPSPADGLGSDAARRAVESARVDAAAADADARRSAHAHLQAAAVRAERMQQCESARSALVTHLNELGLLDSVPALTDPVDPDSLGRLAESCASARRLIAEAADRRRATKARRRQADADLGAARGAVRSAETTLAAAQRHSRQAHAALHAARDAAGALHPPRVDEADIGTAWQQLTMWAHTQSSSLAGQLELLTPRANEARAAADRAREQLSIADAQAVAAGTAVTDAAVAKQKADSKREAAQTRRDELTQLLVDSPSAEEASIVLDRVKTLQQQADEIGSQLSEARAATSRAREVVTAADAAITDSWDQLRRTRDPLAGLGAPEIAGTNLLIDWDLLVTWAAAEAQTRSARITVEEQALRDAQERTDTEATALAGEFARHAVEMRTEVSPARLADLASAAVAAAVATADGALLHAEERLRQSQAMRTEMKSLRESAEVAHMLSNLMRATQFPRWLIASALDALLRDASAILFELSGGQFELTRDERDLLVIDHNDADMSRPVKTLSGGETFQASLSLALALSEQVTALSTEGASKLESIFLDEGFGTLDDATLDVVAGTLENLAASGSRMVGVITHVAALAERIPVRFQVNRDSAGSHIERMPA